MRQAFPAVVNVLKAWALLVGICALLGAVGYAAGGYRLLSRSSLDDTRASRYSP